MKPRKVYMYNLDNVLLKVFNSTEECAIYFNCDREYICHNLKYCSRKRKDGKWYILKRQEIK